MAQFTIMTRKNVDEIKLLYALKRDNTYIVLDEYNGVSTICQYSSKYDQVKIIKVKSDKLNLHDRLQEG